MLTAYRDKYENNNRTKVLFYKVELTYQYFYWEKKSFNGKENKNHLCIWSKL